MRDARNTLLGPRLVSCLPSCLVMLLALTPAVQAQISLTAAVELALRSNPRVKSAQDDIAKAEAQLAQSKDVYFPSCNAGAGLGQAYGYSEYPPTLFTMSCGSVVYSSSQFSYLRSARAGLKAAELSLADVRETVAEDTALAWIALDHDQKRGAAVQQQHEYAMRLVQIVQERLDAGQDTPIGLTQAKLSAAELHLALQHEEDNIATDRDHLARLIDLPSTALTVADDFPSAPMPVQSTAETGGSGYANAGVAAAFASADAKSQQARGESHFRFRPQVNMVAQYNRYATFTDSFKSLDTLYGNHLTANEAAFGVQISIPLFDKGRQAKASESAADASHALHDAQNSQIQALDGQSRLRHSLDELQTQAEVAGLKQEYAQQLLDIVRVQLKSGNPDGQQMTPKDEQNYLISERDKYLGVLDAAFQLRQAEIQLLRATGQLSSWLTSAASQKP